MIPIFDTNIFGQVQSGIISERDWKRLLQHRPGIGWPLSQVTALELLVDLDSVTEESFAQFRGRIERAFRLANGQVLEDPKFLICRDLIGIPPPPHVVPPSAAVLSMHMQVIRRARSLHELLAGKVKAKAGQPAGLRGTTAPKQIVEGVKKQWVGSVERVADGLYPDWRNHFAETGRRLPDRMRKAINYKLALDAESRAFTGELLDWFGVEKTSQVVSVLRPRLDAVVRFTAFVVSEFLKQNYSLEKHASDIFDQFQLHYLALDGFIIVSNDCDLWKRTVKSPQASRIMSFDAFLQSLT